MKRAPQPPGWLPALLHLSHGLIAGGVGYMLAYAAVIYSAAEPGSVHSMVAVLCSVALAIFEIGFFAYIILRRRRMKRLWREAGALTKAGSFEAAEIPLLELLTYAEYRLRPQPVLFALGAAAEGRELEREATVLYRRAGDYPPALRALGMLQLERGLNEGATQTLRKLLAKQPGDTFSTVLLALAQFRSGQREAAASTLRNALERRPKSEMLRVNLARVEAGDEPGFDVKAKTESPGVA